MQVRDLTAWHVKIRLKKEIQHASHTRSENDTLIVRCRLTDGSEGWGEGLPRPYVTGETIDSALEILRASDLRPPFADQLSDGPDLLARLERLPLTGAFQDERQRHGNTVRCAVELAALSAVCKSQGQPLGAVMDWIPDAGPLRRRAAKVRYSGVITSGSPARQRRQAVQMRLFGFRQVKVKVGTDGIDDVDLLARVRRVLGRRTDLRVDANEAWGPDNVVDHIKRLTRFDIGSFEQPVSPTDVSCLRAVREETGAAIMLDESLCSQHDAELAIDQQLCDLFNIRLSKCGGFVPSVRLAVLAHEAGLGYQLGCQVGETGILSAAGRHFATCVAGIRYFEGSYDRFLVRDTLVNQNLTFGFGGRAPAITGAGLGIEVDTAAIERRAVDRIDWQVCDV